ncbi:ATP-dependent helicase [Aeromicrobium fastidiosum]|uniref:ATP-dependent helicase n=1 Tax=Aeromicrobium fastidiosum TaxID=52699 RepID=A0A641AKD0_9ACTN|nr:ATP-dependent helicase [Aeromicrobium fastidiosum]KAA1373617.1 ATP-dependent helicase [Aeromicrobium fastidiosum]MBP2391168.1 ATP-dependent Lhr-like helicase [Aeromicrobium fastidiosum]
MTSALDRFAPATRAWFSESFDGPTPAQEGAWQGVAGDEHVLVVAPTGSGKTLAAFLSAIDRLMHAEAPTTADDGSGADEAAPGTRVLYISPLKALAVDVERNLRSPLVGITQAAARRGDSFRDVTVGVRSGDTSQRDRRALITRPPDILITTPESLFLMLTSAARETLRTVDTVIIDEIHAVAGTKRGAHLAVSLERLDGLLDSPARRIGLSATVRPHDEVARFLAGSARVQVVAPAAATRLALEVEVPVDDMTKIPAPPRDEGSGARSLAPGDDEQPRGSIWPHVEEAVMHRVLKHRSTIIFVNSRGVAERLTARLNEAYAAHLGHVDSPDGDGGTSARAPAQKGSSTQTTAASSDDPELVLARAHHGSVSKEQRALIEDDLKSGRLRCVVATSSLELGIDMGAVDLVIQVSSPPSVASGLQRVGRAGHQVGEISQGVTYPTSRPDLLGSAVVTSRMQSGLIERLDVPANPLDILAQHTVAATALEGIDVEEWFDTVRRSAPFATLPRSAFDATLDLLSGRYPSDEFAELRPRIVWDRDAGTITGRPGAQRLAVTSGGTIPDRGMFGVFLAAGTEETGSRKVGELDEEMVYESRINDVFALGATSWRIQEITHDRVNVTPAFGQPARLPFWKGDAIGRPYELGEAIGAFVREASTLAPDALAERTAALGLDRRAADNLGAYLRDQKEATGQVPSDRTLLVERFRDELGDWRVVLHSPFGRRVHAPWALAVAARIIERYGMDGSVVASDDGIVARIPDTEVEPPGAELFVFDTDELDTIVTAEVGGSALFASRFRECASRALLLPRRNPGSRAPLWQQRQRSAQLLDVARKYPSFPILLETARECLQDVYDLPALTTLSRRLASREVQIAEVTTERASPFAQNLLFGYVAAFLYEGDTPLAERRASALTLDPTLLAELLGRAELRELLDPEVLEHLELELQRLTDDRRAKDVEGVADLLRLLGPLSTAEVQARVQPDLAEAAPAWLAELQTARRVIEVAVAGDVRWAVVEDAGRLRDALGVVVPMGISEAHLEVVADPLLDLVSRHTRTHGPFTSSDVASRFGIGVAIADQVLRRLSRDGRLTEGEFRPQATGSEWVEPGVLRRLRSRSLAAARQQVEPVDPLTFARFLPAWQGVGGTVRGAEGVLATIDQLAGLALPASAWESLVLPARVRDYSPAMLDELTSAGEVVWSGAGSLPGNDGWVQLHPADFVLRAAGAQAAEPLDPDALPATIAAALDGGGAYLFRQLIDTLTAQQPEGVGVGTGVDQAEVAAALWSLVWSGHISNDTFAPVRTLVGRGGAHRTTRPAPRARLHGRRVRSPRVALQGPPTVGGRWFSLAETADDPTSQQLARTESLVGRYGVVTRGSVMAEQTPGGFAAIYRVLRELEQSGSVLRGYYIETLGAAQFGAPATVDRMRAFVLDDERPTDATAVTLAATDPANPYGAALAWPERPVDDAGTRHRPARKAGSLVVMHDGHLVLYLERGGKKALVFDDDPARLTAAARSLVSLVRARRMSRLTIETVDARPVASSALGEALIEAGFEQTVKGLRLDA